MNDRESVPPPAFAPGAWVLHLPSGTVGEVEALHEPGTVRSSVNNELIEAPVLALVGGHTFVAKPDNFAVLDRREVLGFENVAHAVATAIGHESRHMAAMGISSEKGILLIVSALRQQAQALEAVTTRAALEEG